MKHWKIYYVHTFNQSLDAALNDVTRDGYEVFQIMPWGDARGDYKIVAYKERKE